MVVLATKVYVAGDARERTLESLDALVANDLGDLEVEWTVGLRDDGFPSVTVSGQDATAARNLLRSEWGSITPHREAGEVYVGTLERWDEDGFVLDAGDPVRVGADDLGLGPGTASQIRTRFGLVQHVPLQFVEGGAGDGTRSGEDDGRTSEGGARPAADDDRTAADDAGTSDDDVRTGDDSAGMRGDGGSTGRSASSVALADAERDRLYDWTRGSGRVNVNSATRAEVRATVNRAGHAADVVTVERLGLLEQSIVCREGTDPPGILADIGPHLPAEMLCVVP